MTNVNISLRKEAYEFLKYLKGGDKSFSDVVLEFKERKSNRDMILELFDKKRDLSAIDWKEKERRMISLRNSFKKRLTETRKYMEKSRQK